MPLEDLLNIDLKTLISVLFWLNLIVVAVNLVYRFTVKSESKISRFDIYTAAKFCQAAAFCLLFFRDAFPDAVSVNVGNSLLFIGFFFESLSIYEILEVKYKKNKIWLITMLCCSLLFFNAVEFFVPAPNIRVVSASCCVFAIMLVPSLALLFSSKSSLFKRITGLLYLLFTLLLLPRIISMLNDSQASLFTNNLEQSMTFLSLIMVNVSSGSTFLMQMKDNADKASLRLERIDFLTNLPNRYYFLKLAESEFDIHVSEKLPLTVLLFGLDKFKNINEKYGIDFGDRVLVAFSDILRTNLASYDMACRYAGKEALAVLPNSGIPDGYAAAKKIYDEVHATRFEEFPDFEFTVSIGIVSGCPSKSDAFVKYIDEADKLLSIAKSNGGDRIEYKELKQV